jgi:pimeloyl-ACP methyl ester carboxylesterase
MKLFYRKIGEGPPLVILHGLFGSSDNWLTIAKRISTGFTVYLPDQRNHGRSPHDKIHDYDSMSSDLYEFASDLDLRRFFLAGHSMGGKTAMKFAMKWPEMIQGLMIADISPFSDEKNKLHAYNEHYKILKSINDTDVSKAGSRTEAEKLLAERIPSEKVRDLILKNLQRDENNNFSWKLNTRALLNNMDKIMEGLPFPQQITGFPVIFLKGENSEYISEEDYKEITKLFPAAEIKVIKNAGHWLHADDPKSVSEALLSLLNN